MSTRRISEASGGLAGNTTHLRLHVRCSVPLLGEAHNIQSVHQPLFTCLWRILYAEMRENMHARGIASCWFGIGVRYVDIQVSRPFSQLLSSAITSNTCVECSASRSSLRSASRRCDGVSSRRKGGKIKQASHRTGSDRALLFLFLPHPTLRTTNSSHHRQSKEQSMCTTSLDTVASSIIKYCNLSSSQSTPTAHPRKLRRIQVGISPHNVHFC